MKRLFIILFLVSLCYGTPFVLLDTTYADTYTSHQLPITDSTLDIGSLELLWRYIYGDSFTDGTALWDSSSLSGFTSITGVTGTFSGTLTGVILTDGTFIATGGVVTAGEWNGTEIDISDYTNLIAGTNITLADDTLNVDDAFLINDGDDTTTGTLTAGNLTTAGTAMTDILIVGSNPPATASSAGTSGTITYDNDYIYVCIATNTWERTAIATWGIPAENVIYAGEDVVYAAEQVVYP